jgi:hypothetical protein
MRAITWTGSQYVAVGDWGAVITATVDTVWTVQSPGTTEWLNGVAYGASTLVAVGAHGTLLTSGNGVSWTPRNCGTTLDLFSVAYTDSGFIAVGDSGCILVSANGVSWARVESGTSMRLNKVVDDDSFAIALGDGGAILFSRLGERARVVDLAAHKQTRAPRYSARMLVIENGTPRMAPAVLFDAMGRHAASSVHAGAGMGRRNLVSGQYYAAAAR